MEATELLLGSRCGPRSQFRRLPGVGVPARARDVLVFTRVRYVQIGYYNTSVFRSLNTKQGNPSDAVQVPGMQEAIR